MDAQATRRGLRRTQTLNAGATVPAALPRILLTTGEPAGIGPDITLALASEGVAARLIAIGDPDVLRQRAALTGANIRIDCIDRPDQAEPHEAGRLTLLPVPAAKPAVPGQPDPENARYVLDTLDRAAALCLDKHADALVTAPVHKSVINSSGVPFSGHTEYLADRTGGGQPVMVLAGSNMRVALATTHLPLRDVADAITADGLESLLRIVNAELQAKLAIKQPKLLVLGLNPHAGEDGVLGQEEIQIIRPVIKRLAGEGIAVSGPAPADTAFTPAMLEQTDIVIAMFHDQGLPVIKAAGFGEVVNITLGLPIIRTSVDHGTALELAGQGIARHDSLRAAVLTAIEISARSALA